MRRFALLLLATYAAAVTAAADEGQALHEWRAARRASLRTLAISKADGGAPFGLLVIPVDFADARFPNGFSPPAELGPRLTGGEPGSLDHFYEIASTGRLDLKMTLAPVVSLTGVRLDYSDIFWGGYSRSRGMVAEALRATAQSGVDFGACDRNGDGEVDGVLLLHAAPGQENDPDDVIVPQQFFLEDPVVQAGTVAGDYAIGAARSGLGLWAHETGHLFGLEDRYDLRLAPDGESAPRGGLGRYSLMASGWLGTGDGTDPALLDGYSRLQLGWVDLGDVLAPETVVRLRAVGAPVTDYFLVERRDSAATAPYDAGLDPDRAVVYHVDESLAEGAISSPFWPERHLRVQLVEADGSDDVARGQSEGELADLFPVAGMLQEFNDHSTPSASAWGGSMSGVDAVFEVVNGLARVTDRITAPRCDLRLVFPAAGVGGAVEIVGRVETGAVMPSTVRVTVDALDTDWGEFVGGVNPALIIGDLLPTSGSDDWTNYRFVGEVSWQPVGDVPIGALTSFAVGFSHGASGGGVLVHRWHADGDLLDVETGWTNEWVVESEDGTAWHRWTAPPTWADAPGTVLACTGAEHIDSADWPDVAYSSVGWASLTTPVLGGAVRWISFLHAVDVELLHPGVAVDGVALTWVHDGGYSVAAEPVDGWIGRIDPRAGHRLAGEPTFALVDSLLDDGRPVWHAEAVTVPDAARHGPGPWRLRLTLAAEPYYRSGRGWLVSGLEAHGDDPPESAFPVELDAVGLRWQGVDGTAATEFRIERSDNGGTTWCIAATVDGVPDGEGWGVTRAALGLLPGLKARVRVVELGRRVVLSRVLVTDRVGEPTLASPHPNPSSQWTVLAVDGRGDRDTEVGLYDLRGRLLRRWFPGGEPNVIAWDGSDSAGRRLAAGVYIFRVRVHGWIQTRKVTWLP